MCLGPVIAVLTSCQTRLPSPTSDASESGIGEKTLIPPKTVTRTKQDATEVFDYQEGDWFVSPTGSQNGDGSEDSPWDIVTALKQGGNPLSSINPGDVVMLRGGKYGTGRDTSFEISLSGTQGNPVVIRPYPGEHVIINGTLDFYGDYIRLINAQGAEFELLNTDWTQSDGRTVSRWIEEGKSALPKPALRCFEVTGIEFINILIHDAKQGVVSQDESRGGQVYGCLIFNCGYQSIDRGHGHGMYFQNNGPELKSFREVICAHNFGKGIQIFGYEPDLRDILVEGCVTVNDDTIWFGDGMINNAVLKDCTLRGRQALDLYSGFWWPDHDDVIVQNCKIWGISKERFALRFGPYLSGKFFDNRVISRGRLVVSYKAPHTGTRYPQIWTNNSYYGQTSTPIYRVIKPGATKSQSDLNFNEWRLETSYDIAGSTYHQGEPTGVEVEVRPNAYEPGRANIIIHNWDEQDQVSVDLGRTGLRSGDTFEIRNVLNYFGDTPISGTYDHEAPFVEIDMRPNRWTFARPIEAEDEVRAIWPNDEWGRDANLPFPKFGVFIIRKTNGIE
jgi:hypothetical protein